MPVSGEPSRALFAFCRCRNLWRRCSAGRQAVQCRVLPRLSALRPRLPCCLARACPDGNAKNMLEAQFVLRVKEQVFVSAKALEAEQASSDVGYRLCANFCKARAAKSEKQSRAVRRACYRSAASQFNLIRPEYGAVVAHLHLTATFGGHGPVFRGFAHAAEAGAHAAGHAVFKR